MTENDLDLQKPKKVRKPKKPKKKFFQKRSSWYFLAFLLALIIIVLGIVFGGLQGIKDRVNLAEVQAAPKIESQLESARQDIEAGRFQVALQRLDWILEEMTPYLDQYDEEYAELSRLYSQALLEQSLSKIPTITPSPTPVVIVNTPTPDLRGEEELFTTAQQHLAAEEWDLAVQTLDALRNKNLEYRTIEVDGMLYIALRNRGLKKILYDGSLEPGIYDLTLAERFAPLDSSAEGFRTWARFYLTGASYWGVDWSQVVYYFEQVYPALPNLRDGTGMTATERFRIGAIQYGLELAELGDYCNALAYIDRALAISEDPEIMPTRQFIMGKCEGNPEDENDGEGTRSVPTQPEPTQPQPTQPEPTPTPTQPEPTPTPEESEQPTEEPTEEPNP